MLQIPVSHGEGRYVAGEGTLDGLERDERVAFRYVGRDGSPAGASSPNGSMRDIAGIINPAGNVLGMMPHPERACEPILGSDDGVRLFDSVARAVSRGGLFAAAAS